MQLFFRALICVICLHIPVLASAQTEQLAYYQQPAIFDEQVVFASQGDLWLVNTHSEKDGNTQFAKRLTSHINVESNPHISPNGEQLAFLADYHGQDAIYVMPIRGGLAKQVSFEMSNVKLQGWIDESRILYSTASDTGMHNSWVLKIVDTLTLNVDELPLSDAVQGVLSANDILYFVQFGLQISNDNANHYKGGGKGELWKFELNKDKEAQQLSASHEGSIHSPMLHGGRVFFVSNQTGIDNIYSMDSQGGDLTQHSFFEDFAVRSPYLHKGKIAFQHGADIKVFDIEQGEVQTVNIALQSDFASLKTQFINKPLAYLDSASIAHDGSKTLVTARGRMAIASTDAKRLIKVNTNPRARVRHGILSKDGDHVYAVSDFTGEYEIWQFDAYGYSEAKQLTNDGSTFRSALFLSPDGKHLVHTDSKGRLYILELESGKNSLVLSNLSSGYVDNISFSSDSKLLSFAYTQRFSERPRVFLYDIANKKSAFLTSGKYSAASPVFGPDDKWLYFLSDRAFNASPGSPWGDRNMGQSFSDRTQIFAISLDKDARFPFAMPSELDKNTENESEKSAEQQSDIKETNKKESNKEQTEKAVNVDWNGIEQRLWQVDVPAGDYNQLFASSSHLFVTQSTGRGSANLKAIKYGYSEKLDLVTEGVSDVKISGNKEHLLIQKARGESAQFFVTAANGLFPKDTSETSVKLGNWQLAISPQQEWLQMFNDAWLMHRDAFFDADMRGIDWPALKEKYLPLVKRITERSELNDIFKQMMGELNALHSQVRGGQIQEDQNAPKMATLGAVYKETQNGIQIIRIYDFDRELIFHAPPLAKPGVDVREGDIITAVNGQDVENIAQLHQALLNTANQQVLLDLQRGKDRVQQIVIPEAAGNEARFRYHDWTQRNLAKVSKADTNIGYLHLYAMGANDLASFAREFYAQYDKPALIIDVRRNRGGNIDSVIIEKLLRRAWSFWQSPNGEKSTNMQQTFRGHLVVLADEFTYSDGETFTAGIKALNLGTVIGKQTAGAGVWLSGGNNVVDGGIARVAQYPVYAMDGRWITEGRGISPDIEVANFPHATYQGKDAQLDAAINYLQNKLKEQPIEDYNALPFPPVNEAADDIKSTK